MTKIITDEIKDDRRLSYVLLLEQLIGNAGLVMEYSRSKGWTFEEAFIAIDTRIRQLRENLSLVEPRGTGTA